MPKDHTSTLLSYLCLPRIISGAIQHTVPTLLYLVWVSFVNYTAYPKSASLIVPEVDTRILSDLISLCRMCLSCRYFKPCKTHQQVYLQKFSECLPPSSSSMGVRAPPSIISKKIQSLPLKSKHSKHRKIISFS